jgi:hypothetical protein
MDTDTMKSPNLIQVRKVLEEMLDPDSDRDNLILEIEDLEARLADEIESIPPDLAGHFWDLYDDIHYYEPNPTCRNEDRRYFGEKKLMSIVNSFLEHLAQHGYGPEPEKEGEH